MNDMKEAALPSVPPVPETPPDAGLLLPWEAALFLNFEDLKSGEKLLRDWRSRGTGPRYVRFGGLVRYRRADLVAWLDSQTVDPTTEPRPGKRITRRPVAATAKKRAAR